MDEDGDWEEITAGKSPHHGHLESTHRLRVPGGYIYRVLVEGADRTAVSLVFVPDPK